MKNLINNILILLTILFLGCNENLKIKEKLYNNENYWGFTLTNNLLKSPLKFCNDKVTKKGVIYYIDKNDTIWLKGKPTVKEMKNSVYKAIWKTNNREINLTIKYDSNIYKLEFKAIPDSNIYGWGINLQISKDEFLTGLFERVIDGNQEESWNNEIKEALNLNGQSVDMIIKPTLSLYCPFYISSRGYGLFVEGTWPGKYDIGKTNPEILSINFECPQLSIIIYIDKNPLKLIARHTINLGKPILPPKWAFLPFRWRDEHVNKTKYYDSTIVNSPFNSQLTEDILMMKAFDIPCGVYWIDRPWAKGKFGYDDFEWDIKRFPQPEKMIEWLHNNDIKFLLWIAPWVCGKMRDTAYAKGYAIALKPGLKHLDSSVVAKIDFTNPSACKWWQEKGIKKMLLQGVDGFKLDRSEEIIAETREVKAYNGKTMREIRNLYPVLYAKTVNEACKEIKDNDFVLLTRAGYSSSIQYTAFWGGDIGTKGLRAAIIAAQKSAIMGYSLWGSDIGGYWQGDIDREICARWLAFGCFCPIMEFGPTENLAPWSMKKEPHYDTTLIAIWRLYAKIHSLLQNYSYQLAKEYHENGIPIIRPLFLEFPEQDSCWYRWDGYMYGPDILVYNIWQKGVSKVSCYLPSGTSWIDVWNKKEYKGGKTIEIETPIYKIPIFIRKNSNLLSIDLYKLYDESFKIATNKPDLQNFEKTYLKNFLK